MARTTHRLSAIKVANLKSKGLYPDGGGLCLRITATATKSWIYRYSVQGKTRDMGLGPVDAVSLAKAREAADDCRRQRREGLSPIEARHARRAAERLAGAPAVTFKDCAERLIASHEIGWRNAKHRQQWRNTLRAYAYPAIGDIPVALIDTTMVIQVLEPIWASKTETASRLRGRIEAVLSWAKARGLRHGENPAQWRGHLDQLLPARSKVRRVRNHPALPYAEAPAFMGDLRARDGIAARALEFVILTACRTNEGLGARFDEIDLKARLWTVPAERMKGGKEHRVPLSPRAIGIVEEMAEIRINEFVFPGLKPGRQLSNMALLMLLRSLRPGITVHGFRSTFRDWVDDQTSTPSFIAEAALAHVVADKVAAAYRRTDLLEKRRKLMGAWAQHCGRPPVTATVVPLPRAAAK